MSHLKCFPMVDILVFRSLKKDLPKYHMAYLVVTNLFFTVYFEEKKNNERSDPVQSDLTFICKSVLRLLVTHCGFGIV